MKIFIVIMMFIFIPSTTCASEQIEVSDLKKEIKNYTEEIFPEFSDDNWLSEVLKRKYEVRRAGFIKKNFSSYNKGIKRE